jgi:prepilin-type processing-associated H-X9-DG protein
MKTSPVDRMDSGFVRTDLLAVAASLSLVLVLVLSMGNTTRTATEGVGCQNNVRKLSQAWLSYSAENPTLVPNNMDSRSWAWGAQRWSTDPDSTNTANVQTPVFAPYIGSDTSIFRCPSDRFVSPSQRARGWRSRVRSYSMNYYIGLTLFQPFVPGYRVFLKESDLVLPGGTFVFADEHPDSIDDTWFRGDPSAGRDSESNIPASFHNRGAVFSFADGHVELHRWRGTNFIRPVRFTYLSSPRPTNEVDYNWLAQRISQRRP